MLKGIILFNSILVKLVYLLFFLSNCKLEAFSKTSTMLRLISFLRATDDMYTFYNLFRATPFLFLLANPISAFIIKNILL